MEETNFLTMRQVATRLGVSERSVLRRMQEGELHPFKIGRIWKFDPADIDAYIDRQREKSRQVPKQDNVVEEEE